MSDLMKKLITTASSCATFMMFVPATEALEQQAIPTNNPDHLAQIQQQDNNLSKSPLGLLEEYTEQNPMSQVNAVDRLRDVSPTDWAYEALRNLVQHYGCIAGFTDNTYRGSKTLSRYEFASSLNSCLTAIEELLNTSNDIVREDIDILFKLMQEFQTELALLRGRTDGIQARIGELEATQFSTTTKLKGEVIFGLSSVFAGEGDEVTVLGDRVRLALETSFSGKDLLYTRLSTGNFPTFTENNQTFAGNLAFAEPEDNELNLDVLFYSFPVTNNTDVIIGATGLAADDIVDTVNILDGDGGSGAISTFGTRNPIYYPPGETGIGINHRLGDVVELSGGYLAGAANEPNRGGGLFDGSYSAIAQVLLTPSDSLNLALTYVHGYNQSDTETGSNLANLRFLTENQFTEAVPTVNNSYGVEVSWAISDRIIIGGWGALSKVTTLSTLDDQIDRGTQDIWNWAFTLALPDLGKEGNVAGIIVGMQPWVAQSSIDNFPEDRDTSFHVEVFYQYQVTDYLTLTPGVIWINAPDNNSDNKDLVIGTVRTTLSF